MAAAIVAVVCGFEILVAVLLGSGFVALFGFETVVVLLALAFTVFGVISNNTFSVPKVLCRVSCQAWSSLNAEAPQRTNSSCVWTRRRDGAQYR